jgi:protocatechuate 3,4-dioxygenase beta subunit
MRSILRLLFAPALALAVVAACGGSGTPPSASTTPLTTTGAAASASSAASSSAAPADSPASGDATASCTAPATATVAQTEGPYYTAGAPETADLVTEGMAGTRLTLTGFVVSTDCTPIANAKVEIWQADSTGTYDNAGYTLRGYVMTDATGRFTIRTVVPGEYPGRTEHIHVKLTPPGGSTLTTQLYFPGTTANDSDGIYDPSLLLDVAEEGDGLIGTYTFVLGA